jgi:predicted nucleic acid-binding protein
LIVVDASVLVKVLVEQSRSADVARARLRDETLAAPSHLDAEVLSVLRGLALGGKVGTGRAEAALRLFVTMPIERAQLTAHLTRAWQLRANFSAYDALYVALAEASDCPLVTSDVRLSKAAGGRCTVEVFE